VPKPLLFPTKLLIGFDDERLEAVDEWRRKEKDLPSRAEAIRRLVELGLNAPAPKRRRSP
jgi:hypothetical protein